MAKTLLTGATGFIGSQVAPLLLERGDELRVTFRERSNTEGIDALDCERVRCDLLDRRAVRRAPCRLCGCSAYRRTVSGESRWGRAIEAHAQSAPHP